MENNQQNIKLVKGDFIEIEFTGRIKDGDVFDSNKKDVAKEKAKPLIVCIGQGMVVPGLDKDLEGKELGKEYTLELLPKEAFGERQPALVKTLPIKVFHQQQINPQPGMSIMMDNYLVRINAVSGGRVIADFNNPLAGKTVVYTFTVTRKLENPEEKVKAVMNFFFNQEFKFSIEGNKLIIMMDKQKPEEANMALLMDMMKDKFKEMLKLEVEVKESPAAAEEQGAAKEKEEKNAEIKQPEHNHEEHDHAHSHTH